MNAPAPFDIRAMADRKALEDLLNLRWSGGTVAIRGKFVRPNEVEAFGAYAEGRLHGVVTWLVEGGALYLVTLNNVTDRRGVGVALLKRMLALAREKGFPFMRALISNDNVNALRFYQKRGFRISAVHPGVIDIMRQMKPSIPTTGFDGIPMRDEIELEITL